MTVQLRRLGGSKYVTLDGRFQVERQDGETECDHPLCWTLHRRFHTHLSNRGDWMHIISYPAWHVWDNEADEYIDGYPEEFDTKKLAVAHLEDWLADERA